MERKIRLSILDQSIVRQGTTARQAIEETIFTARLAEKLGYYRLWVSEHHNSALVAGSAPEVLIVRLADETKRLRLGSGGIMLPNHSALKVAENFRLLEVMFPGRIDLGMGRAPGGDRVSAALLNPSNTFAEEQYLEQLSHLQAYFRDEAQTQYGTILAVPQSETIPEQWILSSSGGSSSIAGNFSMGLAVAKFINGFAGREIVDAYRKSFQTSEQMPEPRELVAVQVLCADTEEKAAELRKAADYVLLQLEKGNFNPVAGDEVIKNYQFSAGERERLAYNAGRIVSGTPEQVKEQLTELMESLDVYEVMASCMTIQPEDRRRSFELLAETFGLDADNS